MPQSNTPRSLERAPLWGTAVAALVVLLSLLGAIPGSAAFGLLLGGAAGLALYLLAGTLRREASGALRWVGYALERLGPIAICYLWLGAAVLALGTDTSEMGRRSARPLRFVALIPAAATQDARRYEAGYEFVPGDETDVAVIELGGLQGAPLRDPGYRVIDPGGARIEPTDAQLPWHTALRYERGQRRQRVQLVLEATYTGPEPLPELVQVVVAIEEGKRDLQWRLARFYEARYGD